MSLGLLIALLVIALVVGGAVATYNAMIRRHLEAESAWSHIDVQLKRRHDLLPNLMEIVKGYAGHEKDTLENVVQARDLARGAHGRAQLAQAENELTGPLKNLLVLAEAYPQLKANVNFQQLQEEIKGTESRLSFARQYYNDTVAEYNSLVERFPSNVLAGLFGFKPKEFFRVAAGDSAVPRVTIG